MSRIIRSIDTICPGQYFVEIGLKRLFRLSLEILTGPATVKPLTFSKTDTTLLFGQCVRYGLTVRTPFTGTIRKFGFDTPYTA